MTKSAQMRRSGGATVLGFPLQGFGLFSGLLLAVGAAFFTFFATTCIAIFALLVWNAASATKINFADTYLYVGAPAGLLVLIVALPLLAILWLRARLRK